MGKEKRIAKAIQSLEKQIKIHKNKIADYSGKDEYLIDYWEKEITIREAEIRKKKRKLNDEK